ncbi:MAG: hypothetical protein ACYDCI_05770 [Candidatus Limnocylindrales bacterium]
MPITLEKLLSPKVTTPVEFLGETIDVTWAPFRYTGEMQELAERLSDEETAESEAIAELRAEGKDDEAQSRQIRLDHRDKRSLREVLSRLLVSWEVFEGRKRLPTDLATLNRLPDVFLTVVFLSLGRENQPDPQTAPNSDGS